MASVRTCPIDMSMNYLGKKWTIHILRDVFAGKNRFSDFLRTNKGLSSKILSQRLKELEEFQLIDKKVISTTPLVIEYNLTKKGNNINKVLYELAMFSVNHFETELFDSSPNDLDILTTEKDLKSFFLIN